MTITAKFASLCPCCNVRITPGTTVEWSRGTKARHVTCATATADMPRRRSAGRWTGCQCGSRQDSYGDLIPSARNCASCEHDA